MFEWLICAASVAAHVAIAPGAAATEAAPADFLEFLADWDENESMALDSDQLSAGDGTSKERDGDRTAGPTSAGSGTEVLR